MKNNVEHMTIYTTIFSIHSAYTNQNWAKPNLSNQTRASLLFPSFWNPKLKLIPSLLPQPPPATLFPTITAAVGHIWAKETYHLYLLNLFYLFIQIESQKEEIEKWVFSLKLIFCSSSLQKTHKLLFCYSLLYRCESLA